VLLLRAETGEVLQDTTLDRPVFSVALDPDRPLLYVGLSQPDDAASPQGSNHPAILVLDAVTFAVLGEIAVPMTAGGYAWECYKGALVLTGEPALYIVWGYNTPSTIVSRFTLPPPV
jgi:hypothetical protein